jgi:hypothetical protein
VFLIGIADHAGPLIYAKGRGDERKEEKAKNHNTQAQTKYRCKIEVFYGPFLPIWYYVNFHFGT